MAFASPFEAWSYRLTVTVQNGKVPSNLTNFPVYIDLADLPASFFTNVNADGSDIRIAKSDKVTELPREVVGISAGGSTGEVHFEADAVDGTVDTVFYVYYGNSSATEPAVGASNGRNAVWANSYEAVYHMEEDPSGSAPQMVDSTGNGNDMTSVGTMTSGDSVTGKLGKALDFDGTDDGIFKAADPIGSYPLTMEFWGNLATSTIQVVTALTDASIDTEVQLSFTFADLLLIQSRNAIDGAANGISDDAIAGSMKYGAVVVSSSTSRTAYVNAVAGTTETTDISYSGTIDSASIGYARRPTGPLYSDGIIDEVRYSSVARSADWITTCYNNQNDTSTFYSVGSEEESGDPSIVSFCPLDQVTVQDPELAIKITFSENMDSTTFAAATTINRNGVDITADGTITYDAPTFVMTWTPDDDLTDGAIYEVIISTAAQSDDRLRVISGRRCDVEIPRHGQLDGTGEPSPR